MSILTLTKTIYVYTKNENDENILKSSPLGKLVEYIHFDLVEEAFREFIKSPFGIIGQKINFSLEEPNNSFIKNIFEIDKGTQEYLFTGHKTHIHTLIKAISFWSLFHTENIESENVKVNGYEYDDKGKVILRNVFSKTFIDVHLPLIWYYKEYEDLLNKNRTIEKDKLIVLIINEIINKDLYLK